MGIWFKLVLLLVTCFSTIFDLDAQNYRRVISMVPSLTEIVFELHSGRTLIGISDYSTYPDSTRFIEHVGGLYDINPEKIIRLNPDLILVDNSRAFTENLRKLNVIHPTVVALRTETIADILRNIDSLGKIFNKREKAALLRNNINSVVTDTPVHAYGKALLVVSRVAGSFNQVYAAGHHTFLHEMADLCGVRNIVADSGYIQLNPEFILRKKPDYIIEFMAQLPDEKIQDVKKEWIAFLDSAGIQARILILNKDFYVIPGPRIIQAISELKIELKKP